MILKDPGLCDDFSEADGVGLRSVKVGKSHTAHRLKRQDTSRRPAFTEVWFLTFLKKNNDSQAL